MLKYKPIQFYFVVAKRASVRTRLSSLEIFVHLEIFYKAQASQLVLAMEIGAAQHIRSLLRVTISNLLDQCNAK